MLVRVWVFTQEERECERWRMSVFWMTENCVLNPAPSTHHQFLCFLLVFNLRVAERRERSKSITSLSLGVFLLHFLVLHLRPHRTTSSPQLVLRKPLHASIQHLTQGRARSKPANSHIGASNLASNFCLLKLETTKKTGIYYINETGTR